MSAQSAPAPPPLSRAVTEGLLLRSASGARLGRGEKPKALFARVSHFNLQDAGLTSAEGIDAATGARVLYLYDNALASIAPLARLRGLKQLYVEGNALTRLDVIPPEGAPPLAWEKIFASRNRISRVPRALALALPALTELHLGGQRLGGAGGELVFEAGALAAWGRTRKLRVLDVSACGLTALSPLAALRGLEELVCSSNPVADADDVAALLAALPALKRLDVRDCTFSRAGPGVVAGRYRDALVAVAGPGLEWLDGREVTDAHKSFMRTKVHRSVTRSAAIAAALYKLSPSRFPRVGDGANAGDDATASIHTWADERGGGEEGEGIAPPGNALPGAGLDGVDEDAELEALAHLGRSVELEEAATAEMTEIAAAADADAVGVVDDDGDDGETRAPDDTIVTERSGADDGGSMAATAAASLADTLVPSQAASVREASGVNAERAAAPLPPLPKIGGKEGFRSKNHATDPAPHDEAVSPRRTPSDFEKGSRFVGGFSLPADRERVRVFRETARENELVQRMAGAVIIKAPPKK
jgi:hypothetical protein